MAYLDKEGLSYLWSKLKLIFDQKLDAKYEEGHAGEVLYVDEGGNVVPKKQQGIFLYGEALPEDPSAYIGYVYIVEGQEDEYPYISIKVNGKNIWAPFTRVPFVLDVMKLQDIDPINLGVVP